MEPTALTPIPVHADPEGEAPWAMQLVLRMPKNGDPASRAALCAAAARAVVGVLTAPEAQPGREWVPALTRWTEGRIRKHARRARTEAEWDRAQALPGVTATITEHGGASVRAYVPTAVTDIPRDIHRLQLSGSEPAELGPASISPEAGGPLVVSISASPALSLGKAAAAAGHAAQLALLAMPEARLDQWAAAGYPIVVEHPDELRWAELKQEAPVQVVDSGFTEIAPGTTTATASWA